MKNTFKKLTSLAMSFALLGAGSAISKAVAPKSNNITTASAASENIFEIAKNAIHKLCNLGNAAGNANTIAKAGTAGVAVVVATQKEQTFYDGVAAASDILLDKEKDYFGTLNDTLKSVGY